jgi:hypothetical protein
MKSNHCKFHRNIVLPCTTRSCTLEKCVYMHRVVSVAVSVSPVVLCV